MSDDLAADSHTRVEDATPPTQAFPRCLLIIGLVAFAMAAWYAIEVILLLFGGVLVGVLLDAAASFLHRYVRIPHRISIVVVLLAIVGVATLLVWWTGASLAQQIDELRQSLVAGWASLKHWLAGQPWGRPVLRWLSSSEASQVGHRWVTQITMTATSFLWWLTSALVVAVAGIYLAGSPGVYVGGIIHLTPPRHRDTTRELLARLHAALRGWLAGVLVNMTVIGTGYAIGLWLLGVPMALAVGLCAFVLCFVPYLGALVAAALAIAVGFSVDASTAMWVLGLSILLQTVESYILTPLVYQRSVNLPPVVTLAAQLILGSLLGTLGLIFATPLAAVALVTVKVIYLDHTLHDPHGPPEAREPEDTPKTGSPTTRVR